MPSILITGANRGIGLGLCRECLSQGWTVHATCRQPEKSRHLLALQHDKKYTSQLSVYPLDVRNSEQLESLQAALGNSPVDVLVNNAGVHAKKASQFGHCDEDTWEEAVAVNLLAPMKMMECFVDNVADSEMKIIANLSSKMGSMTDNSSGGSYAYRATKAALNAVTVSAAHDLKYRDIIVMVLHPGWVRTDMGGSQGELSVEQASTMLLKLIQRASMSDSGKFLDIDGTEIPW